MGIFKKQKKHHITDRKESLSGE